MYGDGRKYIANLRCENWLVDDRSKDVWQAFLFARWGCSQHRPSRLYAPPPDAPCVRRPAPACVHASAAPSQPPCAPPQQLPALPRSKGEWSEVEIPLSRFLLTWHGKVVEEVVEVNSKRITSVGISLAGGDDQPQVGARLGVTLRHGSADLCRWLCDTARHDPSVTFGCRGRTVWASTG